MNVLLDLDGTLTDPRAGFVGSIAHALNSLQMDVPSEEVLAGYIGPPLEETIRALLGPKHLHQAAEAVALYRQHYSVSGIFKNEVYDGVREALEQLRADDHQLYLATSKPEVFAVRILEHFGLIDFFTGIHGSGLDGTRADKRLLITYLLEVEEIAANLCVMVGDRSHDIKGAQANKLLSVGVLWGYGSRAELETAGALVIVHRPIELPGAVSTLGDKR